jgi:hypothetical protein
MRFLLIGSFALGLAIATGPRALAQDVQAIVDKAILAHGGAEKLNGVKGLQMKSEGTIEIMGAGSKFTQETVVLFTGKFKQAMELDLSGMKIPITTAYDGTNGWISANGQTIDMPANVLDATKEAVYQMNVGRLTTLKEPGFKLAPLGDINVNDKPAVGVKVTKAGQKDINLFFDKESGLLAKVEHRTTDPQTMQEVNEERIMLEYQDIDGYKTAKKAKVLHDGKKYMEVDVVQVKFVDKIDEAELKKP